MRKLVVLAIFALSLFAAGGNRSDNPIPMCNPCDWVR
jgi:hypothetical protein